MNAAFQIYKTLTPEKQNAVNNAVFLAAMARMEESEESNAELIEDNDEVRQLVVATYYPPKHTFVVPKEIDLENKEQVSNWVVQYGHLYINLIDGKTIRVDSVCGIEEPDFKYPDEQEITNSAEEDIDLDDYKDCEFEHFDAELPD